MIAQQIAERGLIHRVVVGSSVHGLAVAGTDDRDEMGVCVEPPEYVMGLGQFESYVQRDQPDGVRSQPGDLDLTVYGLRKYCRLAASGNPTVLLLLFTPDEFVVHTTPIGRALVNLAPAFASLRVLDAFGGYMRQQLSRLTGESGQRRVNRPELIERFGYDTKYAGHVLRLGYQGIEYASTQRLQLPMREESRQHILAVRRGEVPLADMLVDAERLRGQLEELRAVSTLPAEPDMAAINAFLVGAYPDGWTRLW